MDTDNLMTNEVELQDENLEPTFQDESDVVLDKQAVQPHSQEAITAISSVVETEVETLTGIPTEEINLTVTEELKEDTFFSVVLIVIKENLEDHQVEYEAFIDEDKFKLAYPELLFKSQKKTIEETLVTTRLMDITEKIQDSVFYLVKRSSGREIEFFLFSSVEKAQEIFPKLNQSEESIWTDLDKYKNGLVGVLLKIN